MKRLFQISTMVIFTALLSTGCQSITAPEKLSFQDVINRTAKAEEKSHGSRFKIDGEQTFTINAKGQKQTINQKVDANAEMTTKPMAVHFKGNIQGNGQSQQIESYQVGSSIYQLANGSNWLKSEGADLDQFASNQTPSETIQKLQGLLSKLQKDKKDKAFNLKEKKDKYILSINFIEAPENIKQMFQKQMTGAIIPHLKQARVTVNENDIQLKKLDQVITIDKKTFKQEKMDQIMELNISIAQNGDTGTIHGSQKQTQTHQGEYKETIEVPADVKNNASPGPQ
ncbi:hypothetical protein SAMN05444487_106107 [Marininema mesophilum]|uniref:Lipoprotein n=1 Tax=Marininema mesophilum TaxID=1048340 RepID=A0A1H2WEX4_9BACL|nr:DUF6612 family protein [Marininema mesophilum]SDW79068.1 hypothetical protein SAMN05444487_106107 [Marininema mesophilum]